MAKQYTSDGFTRAVVAADLIPGNVLRMVHSDGSQSPFADCVITGIVGNVVQLSRPMIWSNGETHVERFAPFNTSIIGSANWRIILLASGLPYTMIAGPDIEVSLDPNLPI